MMVLRNAADTRSASQRSYRVRNLGVLRLFALIVIVSFGTEKEALAYTDPGTGALIWQMLVASMVGAAFYFRRFRNWLQRNKNQPAPVPPDQERNGASD